MRAALRGHRNIAKALRAQLGLGRSDGRGVKLGHQRVDRHHNQEVKGSGDEDKCDEDIEKFTVLERLCRSELEERGRVPQKPCVINEAQSFPAASMQGHGALVLQRQLQPICPYLQLNQY
jgi:hypothetical protein